MAPATSDGDALRAGVLRRRALAIVLTVFVVLSLVFLLLPGIDIAVSRWAGGPDFAFAARHDPALVTVRAAGMAVTRVVIIVLVLIGLAKLIGHRLGRILGTAEYLFLLATFAIGPGLLVNGLLKEFWGRPRPVQTDLFGGAWTFMPAWVPGGACLSNCSFVSGESASSMWLVALAFVVPGRERLTVALVTLVWGGVMSVNRIFFGGHYLSDVLLAWALVAAVIVAGWGLFLDGAAGERLRRLDGVLAGLRRRIFSRGGTDGPPRSTAP